jgi:hypothetical protein
MGRLPGQPGSRGGFAIDAERAQQVLMVLPEALIALAADGAVEGLNEQGRCTCWALSREIAWGATGVTR